MSKDTVEVIIYCYLNFLFLKQIIAQLNYEMVTVYAYRTSHKCMMKSIQDKKIQTVQFNVLTSFFRIAMYSLVDIAIMSILVWVFGASILM